MDDEDRHELANVSIYLTVEEATFLRAYLNNVLAAIEGQERGEHTHVTDGDRELTVWIMQSPDEEREIAEWYSAGLVPGG